MKTTLLDDYIVTCRENRSIMPVHRNMDEAIKQTHPVAHRWDCGDPLRFPLPSCALDWPDKAMCLYTPTGVTQGLHRFCVDVGYSGPHFEPWFEKTQWALEGVLVFQASHRDFDVIPLVREVMRRTVIMGEVQLHFELDGHDRWVWSKANTGPVNALFHDFFIDKIAPEHREQVNEAIDHLGNIMNLYLGSYWDYIQQSGIWEIRPAKMPKQKIKKGRVKKTYKPGTVGYKQFKVNPKEESTAWTES